MKLKVIDLLNKIANGEEVPKKIHIKKFQSDFIFNGYTYLSDEKEPQNIYWCLHSDALNYEVEIIEEDKKIEKIDRELNCDDDTIRGLVASVNEIYKEIADKINEIITYMNKGDK